MVVLAVEPYVFSVHLVEGSSVRDGGGVCRVDCSGISLRQGSPCSS